MNCQERNIPHFLSPPRAYYGRYPSAGHSRRYYYFYYYRAVSLSPPRGKSLDVPRKSSRRMFYGLFLSLWPYSGASPPLTFSRISTGHRAHPQGVLARKEGPGEQCQTLREVIVANVIPKGKEKIFLIIEFQSKPPRHPLALPPCPASSGGCIFFCVRYFLKIHTYISFLFRTILFYV